jgi:CHAT domain-containing protein
MGKAAALTEAKAWLWGLASDEAATLLVGLADWVARGKDEPALKLTAPASPPGGGRPFGHSRYWAAFALVGDPD